MRDEISELWQYRHLLGMLVRREIKVRYKNSAIGFVWSVVPPLLQVVVYMFVVRGAFSINVPNYSAYLLAAIIPWTFFSTGILDACQSILSNYHIIRKIYMPREVIPLSIIISNFIHFLLGWSVYAGVFLIALRLVGGGIKFMPSMAWFPLITLWELLLVTGISLGVCALNVFYEDVKFILQTLFNLVFFILPILFPADVIYYNHHVLAHPWIYRLYMLNPIAAILEAYRRTLLEPIYASDINRSLIPPHGGEVARAPFDAVMILSSVGLTLAIFYLGYTYFNRRKWMFVERP